MIEWSTKDGVCELVLAHEPCNELGTEMLGALEKFLAEFEGSALVIHSAVRGGFCAGADLRELYEGILSRPESEHPRALREFIERIHRVMDAFDMLPVPTIAVVHGVCFGGGFELALTADLIIAEKTARFCFPELRLGIVPGFGGIPRLRRELPNGVIRDLILTGRSFNAKKAQTLGLVSQMVPSGQGLVAARATASQMTKFDREAVAAAKRFTKPLPAAELVEERELFLRLALRPNLREALRRFVESTDPRPYLP